MLELDKRFKEALMDILSEIQGNSVALFLSGGGDSNTILFGLMDMGIRPHVYVCVPPDDNSKDGIKHTPDYIRVMDTALHHNLDCTVTMIPRSMNELYYSMKQFVQMYHLKNKVDIETMYPIYLTYPNIREEYVITGVGADACFLEGRKANTIYKDNPDGYRDEFYKSHQTQLRFIQNIAKQYCKKSINPFFDERISKLFYGHTQDEVNKPHYKQAEYGAFEEQFTEMERRHKLCYDGLHTSQGGGIREHYMRLLDSPFNTGNYKNMIGIYNRMKG